MAKYKMTINKSDGNANSFEFEIPDEKGTYSLFLTDETGKEHELSYIVVDGSEKKKEILFDLSNGETISAGTFTIAKMAYTISYPAMPVGLQSFSIIINGEERVVNPTEDGAITVYHGDEYQKTVVAEEGWSVTVHTGSYGGLVTSDFAITMTASVRYTMLYIGGVFGVENHTVTRISSPYANAPLGQIEGHNFVYYGDVLEQTATAKEGYTEPIFNWTTKTVGVEDLNAGEVNATVTNEQKFHNFTFAVNPTGYGTVSGTGGRVVYGTAVSVNGNIVTVGGNTFTATPTTGTAQYDYEFSSWSNASGTMTEDRVITANFTRKVREHTVSIVPNNSEYGSVSKASIIAPYGATYSVSGNTLTVNGTAITATPTTDTAQYDYSFSSWSSNSGTITGATTITANFARTTKNYRVTFTRNSSAYGSVSHSYIDVPYGSTISVSSNKVTINGITVTATPTADTSTYDYYFSSWSNASGTITADRTIRADFGRDTIVTCDGCGGTGYHYCTYCGECHYADDECGLGGSIVTKYCPCCGGYYDVEETDDFCPSCYGNYLE